MIIYGVMNICIYIFSLISNILPGVWTLLGASLFLIISRNAVMAACHRVLSEQHMDLEPGEDEVMHTQHGGSMNGLRLTPKQDIGIYCVRGVNDVI